MAKSKGVRIVITLECKTSAGGSNLNYFNIGNYPTGTGSIEQDQYTAENQDAITFGSNKLRSLSLGVYGGT